MILQRETIYAALWSKLAGAALAVTQTYAVPASGPYTVLVASPTPARTWLLDDGVAYTGGASLTRVVSGPAVGQYSVSGGTYTFNAADASASVDISYHYAAFVIASRRLRHWTDVPANDQPALFMVEGPQTNTTVKGIGVAWTFDVKLFIYDNCAGEPTALPGQRLNYLLDAVENTIYTEFGNQTLGGLVSHCWVGSPVEIYEGYVGMMDQSVAIMPVIVKVPDASGPV